VVDRLEVVPERLATDVTPFSRTIAVSWRVSVFPSIAFEV
jgi:hypothetical protein